jgi:hypothetical protein
MDDYPDQAEAVDDFIASAPSFAPLVEAEVRLVLDTLDEKAVAEYLEQLGCEFSVRPGAETYREWLREIARRVRAQAI